MTSETFHLLIIEDDPSEQKLLKMIINETGYSAHLKFIRDGEEAINFINSFPGSETIFNRINLILLDLNLPKINGIEILECLKKNSLLKKVPAIILTTSHNKNDVETAYNTGASGYIRKPSTIQEYEAAINTLFNYWFGICITS